MRTLSREEMETIGEMVGKPASAIYRWRKGNPALFEAVYDYAVKSGLEPVAHSDQPITIPLRKLRATATRYRRNNPGHDSGVVLIWNGTACGWKDQLRDPQAERPGTYAVTADSQVFIAKDGNNYDGAKRWEVCNEN